MMDLWRKLLDSNELVIAGFIGSLVALRFQDELKTIGGRLFFVSTGVVCAYFLTPLAISWYSIDAGLAGGVGFLLGAFGGSLLAAAFRAIQNIDLIALIKTRLGGGE